MPLYYIIIAKVYNFDYVKRINPFFVISTEYANQATEYICEFKL